MLTECENYIQSIRLLMNFFAPAFKNSIRYKINSMSGQGRLQQQII